MGEKGGKERWDMWGGKGERKLKVGKKAGKKGGSKVGEKGGVGSGCKSEARGAAADAGWQENVPFQLRARNIASSPPSCSIVTSTSLAVGGALLCSVSPHLAHPLAACTISASPQ